MSISPPIEATRRKMFMHSKNVKSEMNIGKQLRLDETDYSLSSIDKKHNISKQKFDSESVLNCIKSKKESNDSINQS